MSPFRWVDSRNHEPSHIMPAGMGFTAWRDALMERRVTPATYTAVNRVAVAMTLVEVEKALYARGGSTAAFRREFHFISGGAEEMIAGRRPPQSNEVDHLASHVWTATAFSVNQIHCFDKYMSYMRWDRTGDAKDKGEAVVIEAPRMPQTAKKPPPRLHPDTRARIERAAVRTIAQLATNTVAPTVESWPAWAAPGAVPWPAVADFINGAMSAPKVTHRDMIRAVMPSTGEPMTTGAVHAAITRRFGPATPEQRKITQALGRMAQEGLLVSAGRGRYGATERLHEPPAPKDPHKYKRSHAQEA